MTPQFEALLILKWSLLVRIYRSVFGAVGEESIVFVFGDHGMTVSGDHGGETELETTAALLVYTPTPLFPPVQVYIHVHVHTCMYMYMYYTHDIKFTCIHLYQTTCTRNVTLLTSSTYQLACPHHSLPCIDGSDTT